MSGPQGSDPTQGWQPPHGAGQPAGDDQTQQGSPWQQQSGGEQTWQPPAYTPSEYPPYQQPPAQYYPPAQYPPGYPQQGQYGGQTGYGQPGQYGQPGPYGQPAPYGQYPQSGQPGPYGQQPGSYGQPPAGPKRSKKTVGTIAGVLAAVVVAAILVLGFWAPGFFVITKLDVGKAEAGVQQILTDATNGYGAKNVKDVTCNNGQNPTVKKGATFDCDVSIDGTKRSLTVTFQDNKGTYEVGRPK
jgi:hypothetical protein